VVETFKTDVFVVDEMMTEELNSFMFEESEFKTDVFATDTLNSEKTKVGAVKREKNPVVATTSETFTLIALRTETLATEVFETTSDAVSALTMLAFITEE
jgi:hypothetical protein